MLEIAPVFVPPPSPVLARSFDGVTTDYIQPSTSSSVLNQLPMTMAGWINVSITNYSFAFLMGNADGTTNHQHLLYAASFAIGNYSSGLVIGATGINGNIRFNINTWAHIACTVNAAGTSASCYTNGVLDGGAQTISPTYVPVAAAFLLGQDTPSATDSTLVGSIADAAFWNTVLTGTQIAALAAGRRANRIGANANLLGYWPILGQSPEPDQSGNGNNGIVFGNVGLVNGPPPLDAFAP